MYMMCWFIYFLGNWSWYLCIEDFYGGKNYKECSYRKFYLDIVILYVVIVYLVLYVIYVIFVDVYVNYIFFCYI